MEASVNINECILEVQGERNNSLSKSVFVLAGGQRLFVSKSSIEFLMSDLYLAILGTFCEILHRVYLYNAKIRRSDFM